MILKFIKSSSKHTKETLIVQDEAGLTADLRRMKENTKMKRNKRDCLHICCRCGLFVQIPISDYIFPFGSAAAPNSIITFRCATQIVFFRNITVGIVEGKRSESEWTRVCGKNRYQVRRGIKPAVVDGKQVRGRSGTRGAFGPYSSMESHIPSQIPSEAACRLDGLTSLSHLEHVSAAAPLGGPGVENPPGSTNGGGSTCGQWWL